jgi:hypothetical protein
MPRLILEDIKIQKKNNSIRERDRVIQRTEIRIESINENKESINENKESIDKKVIIKKEESKRPKKFKLSKFFIVFLLLAIASFLLIGKFEKASVVIKAKSEKIDIENFEVKVSRDLDSVINFEIMIINDTESFEINLTDKEDVSIKSTGKVEFYNAYSSLPQKLLAGEFLSDELGKSYKIINSVTIPGYKIGLNGEVIPGKIETTVESFLPGSVYNGQPQNFTINSFKNTDKFKKIYAQAVTIFDGGALGLVYKINEDDAISISKYSEDTLKKNLLEKARAEIPEGYLFYPESVKFSFDYNKEKLYTEQNSNIEIIGSLTLPLFSYFDLSKYLISHIFSDLKTEEQNQVNLINIDKLTFSYEQTDQIMNKEINQFNFLLNGQVEARWRPKKEEIINKLTGVEKNKASLIFSENKGIQDSTIKFFPVWNKKFPNDSKKININIIE